MGGNRLRLRLRSRHTFGILLAAAALASLAIPAAGQAANPDLGVTQTISATKVKPGQAIQVTSTVTNNGPASHPETYVELAALKGKILVFGANATYTSFSTSQGSCEKGAEQAVTNEALVCNLGTLASGQSVTIRATIQVNESAVQTTSLLPKPGENEYNDSDKSNDASNQTFFLNVPAKVVGSKQLKLSGVPRGCVSGNFTLTATSKVAGTKKMKIKADLGFSTSNGRHLLFSKQVNGKKIKLLIPASRAEKQIDEGAFPTYTVIVKAKLGGGHAAVAKVLFKRC